MRSYKGTDGEVANALVCKTSIHGFKSHSVLHNLPPRVVLTSVVIILHASLMEERVIPRAADEDHADCCLWDR